MNLFYNMQGKNLEDSKSIILFFISYNSPCVIIKTLPKLKYSSSILFTKILKIQLASFSLTPAGLRINLASIIFKKSVKGYENAAYSLSYYFPFYVKIWILIGN